jgi:hypothetical protein
MDKCIQCGADTQLHDCGVPICLTCLAARGGQQTAPLKPKPPQPEMTLGSINAKLTATRAEYRHALATRTELERLKDAPGPGDLESQALLNANKKLSIAASNYEDALREFTTFTDPHCRTG